MAQRNIFLVLLVCVVIFVININRNGVVCEVHYYESFDDVDDVFSSTYDKKWVKTKDPKYIDQQVLHKPLSKPILGFDGDKGIQLALDGKHYGISTKFPSIISKKNGKDLVIQYELKFEENHTCGGAYVKLLRNENQERSVDVTALCDETPYSIMFGPDKCGSTNKVHFILQYNNPISNKWEEKHYNETIPMRGDLKSHLYTLHISDDNTFEIYIDMKPLRKGSLLTHMEPPINPSTTIPDPSDSKPATWVDAKEIPDPTASKPDDWDEFQPKNIPDDTAVKPDGWLDDGLWEISDPNAVKPDDWDDEEDGEWVAPTISNPECTIVGCGKRTPPTIPNPLYKGKWKQPLIANPAYIGEWTARSIPNPFYFKHGNPVKNIAPISALAIEVLTMTGGIHFDNFLISDSITDAMELAERTFKLKMNIENEIDKAHNEEANKERKQRTLASGNWNDIAQVYLIDAIEVISDNKIASIISVIVIALSILLICFPIKKNARAADARAADAAATTSDDTPVPALENPDVPSTTTAAPTATATTGGRRKKAVTVASDSEASGASSAATTPKVATPAPSQDTDEANAAPAPVRKSSRIKK